MAILVSTPQDLHNIRNNLSGDYELTNDIDMSSWGNWNPIAPTTANRFTGSIDGNGFRILNLSIVSTLEYTAFIGNARGDASGGFIKNLGLENVYVESNKSHTAGLVGLNYKSTISNCYVTGTIKNTNTLSFYTGGLIGRNYGLVENCFTQCNVNGGNQSGGFVGLLADQTSILKNNYSNSTVSGGNDVGTFYGSFNENIGKTPTLENNFFDKDVAGTTNLQTTGVTAKTTAEMKTQSTFTEWDFNNVWYMEDYPKLRVFSDIPTPNIETITLDSYSSPIQSESNKTIKSIKQLQSYVDTVQTNTERYTETLRNIEGYLSQINSNAVQSHRSVRTGNRNVESFVLPISANVYKESKTIQQLLSYIKPIQASVSVLHPIMDIPVYAVVSTQENNSRASNEQNMSEISYIVNPSYVEVI